MLSKVLAGALIVCLGAVWLLSTQKDAAEDRAAISETALIVSKSEVKDANDNVEVLNNVLIKQKQKTKAANKERDVARRVAADRERRINTLVDDVASILVFNDGLRNSLERIQGYKFDCAGAGEDSACKTNHGANDISPTGMTYKEFAKTASVNLGRCADFIEGAFK